VLGSSVLILLHTHFFFSFFNKFFRLTGMTTKFNQGMYAWMRAKKNEPLSSLRAKTIRVTEKEGPLTAATPSTPTTKAARTASPVTLVEEITPQNKRQQTGDKQKEKADSRSSSV